MRLARKEHPERLPWFAGGELPAAERQAIERHLAVCRECRVEVEALRSMYRTLRKPPVTGHPPVEKLVAYRDANGLISTAERTSLAEHIGECPACSEDLAALDRASRRPRSARVRVALAAAASLVMVLAASWQATLWRGTRTPADAVTLVSLPPPQRGATAMPRLEGSGPWMLEAWPPASDLPPFVARVARASDGIVVLSARDVHAWAISGSVIVHLPRGVGPGRYVLSLAHGDGHASYVQTFEVASAP